MLATDSLVTRTLRPSWPNSSVTALAEGRDRVVGEPDRTVPMPLALSQARPGDVGC
ncbi:MAG: hypothetical protein ACRDZQ_04950 [Acidimicrobiales bacterium]